MRVPFEPSGTRAATPVCHHNNLCVGSSLRHPISVCSCACVPRSAQRSGRGAVKPVCCVWSDWRTAPGVRAYLCRCRRRVHPSRTSYVCVYHLPAYCWMVCIVGGAAVSLCICTPECLADCVCRRSGYPWRACTVCVGGVATHDVIVPCV